MAMISVHSLDLIVISYFGFSFDKHRNSLNVTFCTNTSSNQTFADVETKHLICLNVLLKHFFNLILFPLLRKLSKLYYHSSGSFIQL